MSGPSPCLKVLPNNGSTPAVLPWKPPQKPTNSSLPVYDLARRSGLDGFGAARIELRAIDIARGQLGEHAHECGAILGREATDVNSRDLLLERGHVARVGVAQARHTDAGHEIDVVVAVYVVEQRTFASIDANLAEQREALRTRRKELLLRVENFPGSLTGKPRG